MKKLTKAILVSSLALAAGCASTLKVDNAPVATLDLNRYLGEWYEIARFDHSFERGVEQAKANYTQNADGTIKVVNSGIKDGKPKTAVGKGKTTDTPGLLRVSFFGPFYADYRVMLIDKDYSRALPDAHVPYSFCDEFICSCRADTPKTLLEKWEEKNRKPCPAGKSFGVIGPNGLYRTCLHSLPQGV